jgi:hypothetical protein
MKLMTAMSLAFLLSNNILAETFYSDTLTPKKPYKISQQQFWIDMEKMIQQGE